jgi:uncharacterized protein (DUF934 family)
MALIRTLRRSEGPVTSRDFEVVEHDWFAHADLEGPLPEGHVVVSLARLEAETLVLDGGARLGVRVPSDTRLSQVLPYVERLARIEIEFPKFTDGRGYTLARRLRGEARFSGEIVAVGDVLRDQALLLYRCGFDVLRVAAHRDARDVLRAFDEMTVFYQAADDQPLPLFARSAR